VSSEISYGKAQISLYRTYAGELSGVGSIAESAFTGREQNLFGLEVDVEVFGDNFMPAYTLGDNSNVVATDTMKNFVLRQALDYAGTTLEGFLDFLGRRFLSTYSHMQRLRLTGKELPFEAALVPSGEVGGFALSDRLFSRSHNSYALGVIEMERAGGGFAITGHRCGVVGLQMIKLTGSAFASFARDEYTTLPERADRPLFIYIDVFWKYAEAGQTTDDGAWAADARYVPAEQVRDVVQVVFHEFVSMSIQHLVHEMAVRLLERFPQIEEVTLEAQNRLWDTAFTSEEDPRIKVYTDPRPPYGLIKLTLGRSE
jgi:urate oxidase